MNPSPIKLLKQMLFSLILCSAFSLHSQDRYIVSGSGPSGLLIAISLLQQGHEVLLVENRSSMQSTTASTWGTRPQVLGLSTENKKTLLQVGITEEQFKSIGAYRFYRSYEGELAKPINTIPYGKLLQALTWPVLRHNPQHLIRSIGDLERQLLDIFARLGGEARFNAQIREIADGKVTLLNTASKQEEIFDYKWLINAEGASSSTLQLIGQKRTVDESWETLFFTGKNAGPIREVDVRYSLRPYSTPRRPSGPEHFVSTFYVSNGERFSAGVDLRGENYAKWIENGYVYNYLLAVGIKADSIRELKVQKVLIQQSHLKQFYFPEQRMFVIGDAAHTVNPLIALGANLAIEEATYLLKLFSQNGEVSPKELAQFEAHMRQNVQYSQKTNLRYANGSRLLTHGEPARVDRVINFLAKVASCKGLLK